MLVVVVPYTGGFSDDLPRALRYMSRNHFPLRAGERKEDGG